MSFERGDLPQPGDDEIPEDENDSPARDRDEPTDGPGNISVDEPTQPAMEPVADPAEDE